MARSLPYFAPLLFLAVYLWDGIRALPGLLRRSVSTVTRRSIGTSAATPSTEAACKSHGEPGWHSVVLAIQPPHPSVSSFTDHGSSTVTWVVGERAPVGLTLHAPAVSDER